MLRNRELSEERPGHSATRILPDDDALLAALSDIFGLYSPDGTRFRYALVSLKNSHFLRPSA
jgi:hypothetical protein